MELDEILQALENLTDEQKAKVLEALVEETPSETSEPQTETEASNPATESTEDTAGEETQAESAPPDQTAEETTPPTEAAELPNSETENAAESTNDVEEPIPEMTAEMPAMSEEAEPPTIEPQEPPIEPTQPLADEQGEEMPVDYQQIIDGLNAKNMALEAENKQLKAKVEGAFGLTGKSGGFAKVNPLYDDATDIPPMRKKY